MRCRSAHRLDFDMRKDRDDHRSPPDRDRRRRQACTPMAPDEPNPPDDRGGTRVTQPTTTSMWPGAPYPMGATYDGTGTNFSVYSSLTDRVELCLFDDAGRETRLDLPEVSAGCWHGYLPGIGPGQRYGYRAHGPYFPQ